MPNRVGGIKWCYGTDCIEFWHQLAQQKESWKVNTNLRDFWLSSEHLKSKIALVGIVIKEKKSRYKSQADSFLALVDLEFKTLKRLPISTPQ